MSDPTTRGEAEGRAASPVYHGGDLAQARAAYPDAPTPWIDLSTGINPRPWPHPRPLPAIAPEAWARLPEARETRALEVAAAAAFGIADADLVVATPGTQAAIQTLPRILGGASVGILGFTYQEHAHVWRAAGRSVEVVERLDDLAGFDVAVVVNPNNPDGRLIAPERLAALARTMNAAGRRLIVDEAFVDVLPDGASLAPHLPVAGLVLLRSFGKTWGLAGLRLGFVAAEAGVATAVRAAFGPWSVSGPALTLGAAALADRDWLVDLRRRLAQETLRLDAALGGAGLRVIGGTPLFRLAAGETAAALADRLARHGLQVRRFPHDARLLRFGLPGDEAAWRRLVAALADDAGRRSATR
jgi:cobalamin biosynthetic protein CobC